MLYIYLLLSPPPPPSLPLLPPPDAMLGVRPHGPRGQEVVTQRPTGPQQLQTKIPEVQLGSQYSLNITYIILYITCVYNKCIYRCVYLSPISIVGIVLCHPRVILVSKEWSFVCCYDDCKGSKLAKSLFGNVHICSLLSS